MHQERTPTTVSQKWTQIRGITELRVNSLSDAREFYDPESGSSSGATHVPDQTSTIMSPRTLPRCDYGLPRDTQNGTGNVFKRPPAQEGLSTTFFNNSKNLASSSQELRPGTTRTSRKRERHDQRIVECVNSFTPLPKLRWYVESYWWN